MSVWVIAIEAARIAVKMPIAGDDHHRRPGRCAKIGFVRATR